MNAYKAPVVVIQFQTKKGNWQDTSWVETGSSKAFNPFGNETALEVARRYHPKTTFRLVVVSAE